MDNGALALPQLHLTEEESSLLFRVEASQLWLDEGYVGGLEIEEMSHFIDAAVTRPRVVL